MELDRITSRRRFGNSAVALFLSAPSDVDVIGCAEAGASAYVTLDASADELVETLERAATGEFVCSPRLTASLFRKVAALSAEREAESPAERLTARERQVAAAREATRGQPDLPRHAEVGVAAGGVFECIRAESSDAPKPAEAPGSFS